MFIINNREWDILFVPPWNKELKKPNGTFTIGSCNDSTSTIYINNMLSREKTWKVLCHEITHAAMFSYGIDIDIEEEELFADLMTTYGSEILFLTNYIYKQIYGE